MSYRVIAHSKAGEVCYRGREVHASYGAAEREAQVVARRSGITDVHIVKNGKTIVGEVKGARSNPSLRFAPCRVCCKDVLITPRGTLATHYSAFNKHSGTSTQCLGSHSAVGCTNCLKTATTKKNGFHVCDEHAGRMRPNPLPLDDEGRPYSPNKRKKFRLEISKAVNGIVTRPGPFFYDSWAEAVSAARNWQGRGFRVSILSKGSLVQEFVPGHRSNPASRVTVHSLEECRRAIKFAASYAQPGGLELPLLLVNSLLDPLGGVWVRDHPKGLEVHVPGDPGPGYVARSFSAAADYAWGYLRGVPSAGGPPSKRKNPCGRHRNPGGIEAVSWPTSWKALGSSWGDSKKAFKTYVAELGWNSEVMCHGMRSVPGSLRDLPKAHFTVYGGTADPSQRPAKWYATLDLTGSKPKVT